MAKTFIIDHPDRLRALADLAKEDTPAKGLLNFAKVWSVERRKGTKTPWEGVVYLRFESIGRSRRAYVYRQKVGSDKRTMGALKYAPALKWATENLEEIEAAT